MASPFEYRFAEFVKHVLALRESTRLEALPDLLPVLPVLDPQAPELYHARGETLITAAYRMTAAAGTLPTWWLENPADSNALLVITDIIVGSSAGQHIVIGQGRDAMPAAGAASVATDDERRANTATRMRRNTESAVPPLISGRSIQVNSSPTLVIPMRHVLPPGFTFRVQGDALASGLSGLIRGYERTVQPDELAIT